MNLKQLTTLKRLIKAEIADKLNQLMKLKRFEKLIQLPLYSPVVAAAVCSSDEADVAAVSYAVVAAAAASDVCSTLL